MKQKMYHDGWRDVNEPTGFANSTCGDIFIRILIILMGIGIVALIVLLK
jgi:hypothetical protein